MAIAPRGAKAGALLAAGPGRPGWRAATGTCETSFTRATRCHGSNIWARSRCRRPGQALGGREAHSVFGYLTDGSIWSHWFLPGLHQGLWIIWPLLGAGAGAGLLALLWRPRDPSPLLRVFADVVGPGRGADLACRPDLRLWPGRHAPRLRIRPPLPRPDPDPRLGAAGDRTCLAGADPRAGPHPVADRRWADDRPSGRSIAVGALVLLGGRGDRAIESSATTSSIATPIPASRPGASTPPFAGRARSLGRASPRPAPASTPLFGTHLSNHVQYVGIERPNGGFVAPTTCHAHGAASSTPATTTT